MKIRGFHQRYRLQAGLLTQRAFIHKTGTQYQRAYHVRVMNPQEDRADAPSW
jgi:beta-lactamase class A